MIRRRRATGSRLHCCDVIPIESARVAFAGTPDFAVPSLEAILDAGATVSSVLTQPDRPAGRGRELRASPVKRLAVQNGIEVMQPQVLDATFRERLSAARPDLLVVVAFGLILPDWMLQWPTTAAINLHASLLPRWRGAAPIQRAILAGDEASGVSIMRIVQELDAGPVYRQAATRIGPEETAGELHDRLATLGAALLVEVMPQILSGTLQPVPQDDTEACYAPKIGKRDAIIDWALAAVEIERCVRAYNPWPVAETRTGAGVRLRIWQAEAVAGESAAPPGTVVDAARGTIDVATGAGLLRLKRVQASGGRPMSASAYLAAHDLRGACFAGPA